MNDSQKKMLELLNKFDNSCHKYGITYYLGGGTALGAIRNGGFLPWDDDTDIYITRKNYLKLLDVQNDFFSKDFVLVNSMNFPKYKNTVSRCIDTKSTAITKGRIADDAPKGQFLEIFILDPLPKSEEEQEEWKVKHWVYAELLSVAFLVANKRIIRWTDRNVYNKYLTKCDEIGKENVLKQLEDELFTIPEENANEYCSRWGFRYLIYNKEWFQKPRYVPFEDTKLPVATQAEQVLRFDYGDKWMYIPEKDNQVKHSMVQNMNIGYKNCLDDYSQFIDIDRIYSFYKGRKEKLLDSWFAQLEANQIRRDLKELQVITSISYNIPSNIDIDQLIHQNKLEDVKKLFSQWYKNQFSNLFWSVEKCINIDDKFLYYAILPVLIQGRYSDTRTLLLWRKREFALSEELQVILDYTEAIREIYIALDEHKEMDEIKKLLQNQAIFRFSYYEMQYDYNKFEIMIKLEDANVCGRLDLENRCKKMLIDYPDDGELISLYGDIMWKFGNYEDSVKYYKMAYQKTRNCFTIKHISNRIDTTECKGDGLE